tara:strand:- start:1304 stop:1702 length:399 start_codon:yes stop_codon:yes gene_type:complete
MKITAHGLTLIETLLASVLLAVLAAAVLPLIAELRHLDAPASDDGDRFFELATLADEVMRDPTSFGVDLDILAGTGSQATLNAPWGGTCELHALDAPQSATFTWAIFTTDSHGVSRPLLLSDPDDAPPDDRP